MIKDSFSEDPFSLGTEGLVQDDYLRGAAKHQVFRPAARGLTDSAIVSVANNFSREVKFSPGKNIYAFLKKLKGRVWPTEFWDVGRGPKGSIWVRSDGPFIIWTSKGDSTAVERFTIAHELGHYVLHFRDNPNRPKDKHMMAGRYDNGASEREANIFAINLLLPRKFIEEKLKSGLDVHEIASDAKVDSYLVEAQMAHFDLNEEK